MQRGHETRSSAVADDRAMLRVTEYFSRSFKVEMKVLRRVSPLVFRIFVVTTSMSVSCTVSEIASVK